MWDFAKFWLWLPILIVLLLSEELRSCFAPFFFALLLALAVREPIGRLERHMPRWLAALFILTLVGLLGLCAIALAVVRLWQTVPALAERFRLDNAVWETLDQITALLPQSLQSYYQTLLEQLARQSSALLEDWSLRLTQWAAGLIKALPGKLFTFGITLLATYYTAADWHRIRSWLLSLLPEEKRRQMPEILSRLRTGVGGWLKAQGKLMALCFLILAAGFFLLKISGILMKALLIAIADALPFIGTGLILIPWAVLELLQGSYRKAVGLAGIWIAATICRSVMEPRLLGRQAGVSPLLTLMVMYFGLRLCGLTGLILGPVALTAGMALKENCPEPERASERAKKNL